MFAQPPKPSRFSPFILYVSGQTATFLSFHMLCVAIGWQMYDVTHEALDLGLVGLVQFLPQFFLTLVVGRVADSHDRRRVAWICMLVQALVAGALAFGSFAGALDRERILLCALLIGAARAFEYPTMQALLPSLVEPGRLPQRLALSASSRQTGFILGPALGGLIYAAGAGAVYATCMAFYLIASALVFCIPRLARTVKREPVTVRSLFGGITYIRGNAVLLGAISLDLFSVLLGGATALLPIFARDVLFTGPWGLGLLRAAPAVGALAMSLHLARRPLGGRVGRTMFLAVLGFGLATAAFGLSRWFALSLASLVALGAFDMISVVIRSSLVQLETPDAMRGRVSSVNSVFIGASNQLGEFESGLTAAWFGAPASVVLGGVGAMLVALLWMRFFPELRARDRLSTPAKAA
jgi:MFS family permease